MVKMPTDYVDAVAYAHGEKETEKNDPVDCLEEAARHLQLVQIPGWNSVSLEQHVISLAQTNH
jgi:hypothetical protein